MTEPLDLPSQRRWDADAARRRRTLTETLARHGRERPDATAFTFLADGDEVTAELTFGELDRRARTIASELLEFSGRRAVLIYPSNAEFVAALFGCLYAGVVAVHAPLVASTPDRTLSRVEVLAGKSEASVVLAPSPIVAERGLFVAADSPLRDLPWRASDELAARDSPALDRDLPEPDLGRLAVIQFTSGTTGTARGIPLRHDHVNRQLSGMHAAFDSHADSVTVGWTPLFHDLGLFLSVFEPVYSGHRAVIVFPLAFLARPLRWLRALTRFGGTISAGPNFAYDLCVRKTSPEERSGLELSRWENAVIGGEQIRPATLDRFVAAFAPYGFDRDAFQPGYGLAEAACAIAGRTKGTGAGVRRFDAAALASGRANEAQDGVPIASGGYAYGEHRCLIVDPQTRLERAPGRIGEVWVKGANVAEGYWNEPEATAATFGAALADTGEGPFLRSGDLAFALDGELFIVGRIKDIVIIGGRNVYPEDIEATVQACHPALRPGAGAAFSIERDERELLVVAQEVRFEVEHEPGALKRSIADAVLADHGIEELVIVLLPARAIPKTTSGKIQRRVCRERFLADDWRVPVAG